MTFPLLRVAVVGHTNTGKTSLLRTLTRDADFGEVSSRPATTRHVEASTLLVDGVPALELFDTPGLEDSPGLLDHLDDLRRTHRGDPAESVERFLAEDAAASSDFSQEALALRQLRESDAALYVVDARDRVLGKHRDELEILGRCARPVLPLLNFVTDPDADPDAWRTQLARVNMHAVVAFDSVVFDELGELRLYETLRLMLPPFQTTLDALLEDTRQRRTAMRSASVRLIADLLIDAAAYRVSLPETEKDRADNKLEELKGDLREAEQRCVDELLALHRFRPGDYLAESLPITDGSWGLDLFSAESLKQFGLSTGTAAATGALAGLGVDALAGGLTLGAGTAAGALIGAVVGAARTHGQEIVDRLSGTTVLRAEQETLSLLALRQLSLVRALLRRGHASQERLRLAEAEQGQDSAAVAKAVTEGVAPARRRPEWCRLLTDEPTELSGSRTQARDQLAERLVDCLIS